MSLRAVHHGPAYRGLAALNATLAVVLNLVMFPGIAASFVCLLVALGVTAYGSAVEQKSVFFTGLAMGIVALLYHLRFAVHLYSMSPWVSLAVLGVATVIAASLLERHHKSLAFRGMQLRKRVSGWSL